MKNLFIGIIHREEEESWLTKYSKSGLQIAANNFQWNFIKGLEENLNQSIDKISTLSMGSFPKGSRKLFVNSKTIYTDIDSFFKYIGYVNFYLFKGFCRFVLLLFELKKWIKKNPNGNIYVYSLYSPYLWALYFTKILRKNNNVTYCIIVPDMMGKYGIMDPFYTLEGVWYRIDSFFKKRLSKYADCYVFLTKHMATPLNIGNKPYSVIEGLISMSNIRLENNQKIECSSKKIILYTGSLSNIFGIETLLRAFLNISNDNYELWLCGPTKQSKTVLEYSLLDKRIKYLGFLRQEEVLSVQQKATVLINPRPNIGEYVKYSFPSKTMEYLLSSKPVIMFKLDGLPEDYYDYIYFFDKYDVDSIAKTITAVCEKTNDELMNFGSNAQKFIINNKNSKIQTKKAITMIEVNKLTSS